MKQIKFLAIVLFSVLLYANPAWGDEYSHSFTGSNTSPFQSAQANTYLQTATLSNISWTIKTAQAASYFAQTTNNGLQVGSKNNPSGDFSLTTDGLSAKKITQIKINCSRATNSSAKLSATVGGTAIGTQSQNVGTTNSDLTFTNNSGLTGDIVISCANSVVNNKSTAVYIKSITITYTTAANVAVTGVSLNKSSTSIVEGNTETLTATVAPSNATNKAVTWSTSNASVATVSNGVVTAVSEGTATITVKTSDGNKTATCSVTVQAAQKNTYKDLLQSNDDQVLKGSHPAPSLTDKTAATTGTCEQQHYHFMGWVTEANKSNPTDENIITAGTSMTADGSTYYAVWAKGTNNSATYTYGWESTDDATNWTITDISASTDYKKTGLNSGDGRKSTSSIQYKNKISPTTVSFWHTKNSGNSSSGNVWNIQTSTDGSTWTTRGSSVGTSSLTKGTFVEKTLDLSSYKDVYVRIIWNNTAYGLIDDVSISCGSITYSDYLTSCCTQLGSINGSVDVTQQKVTWNAVEGASGYKIRITDNSDNEITGYDWTDIGNVTEFLLSSASNLTCNTSYKVYIKPYNNDNEGYCTGDGTASSAISVTTAACTTPTVTLTTTSLTGFNYNVGSGPSAAQTFTVSGVNLTANISITAPTNYEISTSSSGTYSSSLTLTQSDGTVSSTTIYVRLKADLSVGTYNSENITCSSTDAADKTVTLSGTVLQPATITLNNYEGTAAPTNKYAGDSWTLPSTNTFSCNDKTFVGWSTVEIANSATKPNATTYYEPGTSVTLGATNTFYAVFAEVGTAYYEKATTLTDGRYLIVSSNGTDNVAFDGSLETLDASGNVITVTISNNKIEATATTIASEFIIDVTNKYVKSKSGKYINQNTYGNGLSSNDTKTAVQSISIISGELIIEGTGKNSSSPYDYVKLRYNKLSTSGNNRFRFYKSGQEAIYAYKYVSNASNYSTSCEACKKVTVTFGDSFEGGSMSVMYGGSAISSGKEINACTEQTLTVTLTSDAHYSVSSLTLGGTATNVGKSNSGNTYTITIPTQAADGTLTITPAFAEETPLNISFSVPSGYGSAGSVGKVYSGDTFKYPNVTGYNADCMSFIGWVDATSGSTFTGDGTVTTEPAGLFKADETSAKMTSDKTYKAVFGEKSITYGKGYAYVSTEPTDWSGDYLIVYKSSATEGVAMDGSLATIDTQGNYKSVTIIDNNTIQSNSTIDAYKFTIAKSGDAYTIKSASGKYIGWTTADKNGLNQSDKETDYTNTLSVADGGANTVVASSAGHKLQYNNNSGQTRFRYYSKASQQGIRLYKYSESIETYTYTYTTTPSCSPKYAVKLNGDGDLATKTVTGGTIKYNNGTKKLFEEKATVDIVATAATGYTFSSWKITTTDATPVDKTSDLLSGTNATTASTSFTMPAYDVNITATFTQNNYTITVSSATNGSITAPTNGTTAHFGDEVTVTVSPNTGYEVTSVKYNDGSDHEITITGNSGSFTMPDHDVTISATFALSTYTIAYDLDGGEVATANPTSYQYTSEAITLTNPTREGYTFTGWSGTGLTGSANTEVIIPTHSTGNRSYTAHWKIITYTVTWLLDGEAYTNGNPSTSVDHGSKVSTLPTPPDGKRLGDCADAFVGWSTENIGSQSYSGQISDLHLFTTPAGSPVITKDMTFYAVFGKEE